MFRTMIMDTFNKLEGFPKMLAERALATKEANYDIDGSFTHWFYDTYLLNKVRNKFGGRIKFFITGSAPLAPELSKSIKVLFSVPILEAYGMTETTGGAVCSSILDSRNLNCGGSLRSCNIKLIDVPEMNYKHTDVDAQGRSAPTGEICVKGLNITKGYFRDRKNTEASFDKDGWLHTGDVGRIMPEDNGLKVIDRVKEIFKLAQGEYIAPSKLEGAYGLCPYIEQICIHGDSFHTHTIAIIYPNKSNLKNFLVEKGELQKDCKLEDVDKFLGQKVVQDEIIVACKKIAKEKAFNPLETIRSMIVAKDMFTQQNGLLTDTMKLKRKSFQKTFDSEITTIYGK